MRKLLTIENVPVDKTVVVKECFKITGKGIAGAIVAHIIIQALIKTYTSSVEKKYYESVTKQMNS